MTAPVLSVRGLTVTFTGSGRPVPAVRGIDFEVHANEVLGIVGESGSGKSVTSLAISGLLDETAQVSGSIRLSGVEVTTLDAESLRQMRGRDVGMVFQDPTTTLNPVLPIGRQVIEGQVAHGQVAAGDATARAVELLREVDIPDPQGRVTQFPHQFSGGMRQRVVIAMAMAGRPRLIIADEPTTALDVTVQAQVLAVLARRQRDTGAAVILITHDLGVVAEVAHRVAVMYGGRIVETGLGAGHLPAAAPPVYRRPAAQHAAHRYASTTRLIPIPGQPPSPAQLPGGCSFHPRCAIGRERPRCASETPALVDDGAGHASACHYADEVATMLENLQSQARQPAQPRAQPDAARAREPLLAVEGLQVFFPVKAGLLRRRVGWVRAVDGVSLTVRAGETVGLVGESGCGKTTTGRAIMGLVPAVTGGAWCSTGSDITDLPAAQMRKVRRHMQYIFQDPYSSLNPIKTVGDIVAEPLRIHGLYDEMGGGARWVRRTVRPGRACRRPW